MNLIYIFSLDRLDALMRTLCGWIPFHHGHEIILDIDEEVIGISGTAATFDPMDKLITSLCFKTNKKNYDVGEPKDTVFEFSKSWDVGSLVGFHGRCGFYLDGFGMRGLNTREFKEWQSSYESATNALMDESIDSAFARFNTIITGPKALDEGYSSKNYVRKFLRALHSKWRANVIVIEESKDLTSQSLDEVIGNLKVHEIIIKKVSEIVKAKGERKSLPLKAKKESSEEECLTSRSEDEEYAMAVRDFKKFFKCGDPNHLIGECPKPPKDKNQRAFVGGSWSDSGEEDDEKAKDETCLVAQASNEICLGVDLEPDEWIKDTRCSRHMTGYQKLFSTYKAYNEGNVIFGSNLRGNIIGKESLNVTFDETPSPSKTSPLVDDDLDEAEAIKVIEKKNLENDIEDETLEIDKIVNIKKSKNHPLENVIGNLNQRTISSQAQNQSNFFCFISTIELKNVNEALTDES
nr:retrovirus-related Pol polyprotein from transposon TNT 1-94 [Tanacetum cinerariifolium]